MHPTELVRDYYQACATHDFERVRALLEPGFRFRGPLMSANGREEFLAQMAAFDCSFRSELLHVAEVNGTVAVLSECTFTRPFTATVRMAEWLTVREGRIAASELLYDSRSLPAAAS